MGTDTSASPAGVTSRAVVPRAPRSRTSVARIVACAPSPNVVTCPTKPFTRAMTRASSPLTTARVAPVARSRTSALASAIASTDAKCPTCASPTLVHTRTSGSASSTSRLISPAWFIPSSTTATSGRLRSSSSVSGRPMWLFRFPTLRYTVCRVARNSAVASFVDVFPALPVIATTDAPDNRRMWCPSSCNAVSVSSTSIVTAPDALGAGCPWAPARPVPLPRHSPRQTPRRRSDRRATR